MAWIILTGRALDGSSNYSRLCLLEKGVKCMTKWQDQRDDGKGDAKTMFILFLLAVTRLNSMGPKSTTYRVKRNNWVSEQWWKEKPQHKLMLKKIGRLFQCLISYWNEWGSIVTWCRPRNKQQHSSHNGQHLFTNIEEMLCWTSFSHQKATIAVFLQRSPHGTGMHERYVLSSLINPNEPEN